MKKLLLLSILFPSSLLAATISGSVKQWGQQNNIPAASQEVILKIFEKGKQIAAAQSETNQNGVYSFDVQPDQKWFYQVSVPFDQTFFDSDFFVLSDESVNDIIIAPTTVSNKEVYFNEMIFFEFGKSDLAKVSHQIEIHNQGKRTYHPKKEDAQPLAIQLIDGGFNLSLVEGITRQETGVDEETSTMFINVPLLPDEKRSFRFSYMYPLESGQIHFKRANANNHQSLHIISNQSGMKIAKVHATPMEIPESLGTKFVKAFEVHLNKPMLDFSIGGIMLKKNQLRMWFLYLSILLCLAMIILILRNKNVSTKEDQQSSLIAEIKELLSDKEPTDEKRLKIDLLKRRLYYKKYGSLE